MKQYAYNPERDYLVNKVSNAQDLSVSVPGSKSITNRALLIAALAEGKSLLQGVLFSDDSRHFLQVLIDLGFEVEVDEEHCRVSICGCGGRIPKKEGKVYVGSAGTAARFLAALLGMSGGRYEMQSSEQMKKRPMNELLVALAELGAHIEFLEEEGHFPFIIGNDRLNDPISGRSEVSVDVDKSSQFLSALLIASVLFDHDLTIHVTGSHGMAYVRMTIAMMKQFGVEVREVNSREFCIAANAAYKARDYRIEPDLSAACYFYGMSPLLGVKTLVEGVHSDSMQGDIQFLKVLEKLGCSVKETEEGMLVSPADEGLKGGCFDLSSFSDQALTLAALAPFCKEEVTISGIGHIRYQECDRISAILTNLTAMGVSCQEREGSIVISPSLPQGTYIQTYDDHRVAMAFSLPGLVVGDMIIENYRCCRKTFENYFEMFKQYVYQ